MRITDLRILPKFRDGWSYLYVDRCRVDREQRAVAIQDATGTVHIPCAQLALLMLGPGVTITHAAIMTLADSGTVVVWCGEQGVRFYASGVGKTRSAANLLHQARCWADRRKHEQVVRNMYAFRFPGGLPPDLTLRQIRGREGVRVRDAYARASREYGIEWRGRRYHRGRWSAADPVNRALSAANSCLYGVCHAAIVACGFSPALGFIHTGKLLSFVYDVADLFKIDVTVPVAFREASQGIDDLESRVRRALRHEFATTRLMERIVKGLFEVLGLSKEAREAEDPFASDGAAPSLLWDPSEESVEGGKNYGDEEAP